MQLLWLICHLTAAAAAPATLSIAKIWRLSSTRNDTDARLKHDYREDREQRICETGPCNQIARKILESRDSSADPCENFYQYACGSWEKHNPIPDNEVEWSEDQIIMENTYKRVKDVLEQRDKPADILPVRSARKLYRSCMNVDAIERKGLKPIQDILDSTGGWPIAMPIREWNSNKISWQKIDKHYIRLIGNSAFYNIEYEADQNNTKRYVLTIDQDTEYPLATKRDLSKIFNDNDTYALGLYRIAEAFAKGKGYDLPQTQLINDVSKLVNFEIELLQIIETGKEAHLANDNYKKMTIGELQEWYNSLGFKAATSKINFLEEIQHVFMLANISINASEPIVVYNPEFLHKLARLLGNTSRRVLVNYVQWNMVDKFLQFTTQEMKDIRFNSSFSSYNISNYTPRWESCVINMKMKDAVSYMFVKEYIPNDVIEKTKEMVKKIKEELRHRIMHTSWVSKAMKETLAHKLDNIETQIGYPDFYKNDQDMIQYYEGLKIGTDYFQNILNCDKHELVVSLKKFLEPVARTQWLDYPITVNAFYTQTVNAILIPAAELQDPYFTPLLPDAVNYGGTGFVIGHELSHSLDNEGIQYDTDGYKTSWISQDVLDEYEDRATCFINQYGNYTLDSMDQDGNHIQLDGNLTKDENLADSVGLQVAYSAYKKLTKGKPETKLPGLEDVTNDELFFLAFANSWCSSMRPEYETEIVNNDEHSPAKYRIIGSLSNLAAFSQTYKCPRNSSMNPQNKCNPWN
ncbi:neprilysin-4-like isoform X1 [Hylaeus anthracinus]|uniref:neprilysin-4-like isoform X1 n=1 Tax=Hylaeus anthracinus TaxID=313031 RepID=UPI0023B8EC95|nr:neprilysin-4-like isoform X1 [Hylaeus anthracinus]